MSHLLLDPLLAQAVPGDLVGVRLSCPRGDCSECWDASASVVNVHGVGALLPARCPVHQLRGRIVAIEALFRSDGTTIYADGVEARLALREQQLEEAEREGRAALLHTEEPFPTMLRRLKKHYALDRGEMLAITERLRHPHVDRSGA
jgi:hypothetical protein